jgi:hypothetical protein
MSPTERDCSRSPGGLSRAWVWAPIVLLAAAGTCLAATPDEGPQDAAPGPPQVERTAPGPAAETVDIDKLLRLPDGFGAEEDRRTGASPATWRNRFADAREDIEAAKKALAKSEKELESASGGSSTWQVSAPGSDSPQTSPLSFRLRQDVKEHREEIIRAERRLRALAVEADLASVPPGWRE